MESFRELHQEVLEHDGEELFASVLEPRVAEPRSLLERLYPLRSLSAAPREAWQPKISGRSSR